MTQLLQTCFRSLARIIGGHFATESPGQLHRNIHIKAGHDLNDAHYLTALNFLKGETNAVQTAVTLFETDLKRHRQLRLIEELRYLRMTLTPWTRDAFMEAMEKIAEDPEIRIISEELSNISFVPDREQFDAQIDALHTRFDKIS